MAKQIVKIITCAVVDIGLVVIEEMWKARKEGSR